ncbi:exo-alpha-sialidase [Adhaeribacter radiodurans]|uniref:Exo-alpha-sialidase n=1 Tax=Adhaeribacter radiodurans TaxID=2745197 RepID=A0A7L7L768_9BACT|nr:exo-alpha-sialidase [Adhaeribacter radiodurans]QMU28650.1 exo-alpha-sialidase [Adhaeribacter radiodurans]
MHNQKFSLITLGLLLTASGIFFSFNKKEAPAIVTVSTFGKQPVVTVDAANTIKVVFGQEEEVFYTTSSNNGQTFTPPQKVGKQKQLALGMTRGPQITTTKDYTVIAAAAHTGKILVYRLKNNDTKWSEPVNIVDRDTTAKEGFVALASGTENTLHAAWLDLRLSKKINIFTATSKNGGKTWSKNKLAYAAPEGGICPCCRPSITADTKGKVYIMFRNELNGSRDMYLVTSSDNGQTFGPAKKLGMGTWVLKACPMDGGALALNKQGNLGSTWRRENTVYYAEPGTMEQKIGEGRASSLVKTAKGNYFVWQQGNQIVALAPGKLSPESIGTGTYPRLAALSNQQVLGIWETNGKIVGRLLP